MRAKDICADDTLTDAEKWKKIYGTDYVGNLPQHLKHLHKGHCWASCPYDSLATDMRTRHLLELSDIDPLPDRVLHISDLGVAHYMKTSNRGGWGYECTYSGCPSLLDNGKPYFYK